MASIETLSEDVLLHIFGYLNSISLKNAALVCTFWNDAICGSSRIMRNFVLNLSDVTKWIEKFDEIMSLKRRFQAINITLRSTDSSYQRYANERWTENAITLLLRITGRHGTSVRKLVLTNGEFGNPNDFCNVLSCMPLLNELIMTRVTVNVEEGYSNENRSMVNELNKLTVETCNWNIFKFFEASPVKELQILNKFMFVDDQQRLAYMNFLEAATKLESIEFDYASHGTTFRFEVDNNTSLKLKRLKYLSFSELFDSDIDKNFGLFIESQSASLTELDLTCVSPYIVEIIFTKLKHLEKLRLNAVVLPTNTAFYGKFRPMMHLKDLYLRGNIQSEVSGKGILVNCCNLETLTVSFDRSLYVSNLLTFMAAHTPMLKSLSLDALPTEISTEAKFRRLKFLHIRTFANFENILKFLDNNDTVDTLSLDLYTQATPYAYAFFEALPCRTNLLYLIVSASITTLDEIHEKIIIHCKKWKSLSLRPVGTADNVFIQLHNRSGWEFKWPLYTLQELFDSVLSDSRNQKRINPFRCRAFNFK